MMVNYKEIKSEGKPIRAWINNVHVDEGTYTQLKKTAQMPFIYKHLAVMPDCHVGKGATIGSVIPTLNAIIPAAVGVDLGCGMMAIRTSMTARDLPESLKRVRESIESVVPLGFDHWGKKGYAKPKSFNYSELARTKFSPLHHRLEHILDKHPKIRQRNITPDQQMGSLGGGNHFIEICLDESQDVWIMLHSGSRGIGNRIGTYFIELAKKDMEEQMIKIPDRDLAYLSEGSSNFADYVEAVEWAQEYAMQNRVTMMENILTNLRNHPDLPEFQTNLEAVNCHHNYISRELHFDHEVYVTRKGAIRAGVGELGIIPGSMGARSFIVRGKGNPDSFNSCSHGAGRVMSRTKAKKMFTLEDHKAATQGVECRKDRGVIDETPKAYKDIDKVMAAQNDLVDIVHTLKQVVCVKG